MKRVEARLRLSLSCECRSLWLVVGSLMVWGAMGACMNVPSMELLIDTAMYVHALTFSFTFTFTFTFT